MIGYKIQIFLTTADFNASQLLWSGNFPKANPEGTATAQRDDTPVSPAVVQEDESKEFTVEGDTITFTDTSLGQPQEVVLERISSLIEDDPDVVYSSKDVGFVDGSMNAGLVRFTFTDSTILPAEDQLIEEKIAYALFFDMTSLSPTPYYASFTSFFDAEQILADGSRSEIFTVQHPKYSDTSEALIDSLAPDETMSQVAVFELDPTAVRVEVTGYDQTKTKILGTISFPVE